MKYPLMLQICMSFVITNFDSERSESERIDFTMMFSVFNFSGSRIAVIFSYNFSKNR